MVSNCRTLTVLATFISLLVSPCHSFSTATGPTGPAVEGVTRRQTLTSLTTSIVASSIIPSKASAVTGAEVFVGTYSDPINHPGGKRSIKLVGEKVGDYQLAEVYGGGGRGEPKDYVLPAVIIGDRSILIDFTPKGGPRDFQGVATKEGIRFIHDNNLWPRL